MSFAYNANGNVTQMTTPNSGVYAYTYVAKNNLASVTYPDENASDYAKQAVNAFGDPPYTTIKTEVSTSVLPSPVNVDGGIPAYVIPNEALPSLTPTVLDSMSISGVR